MSYTPFDAIKIGIASPKPFQGRTALQPSSQKLQPVSCFQKPLLHPLIQHLPVLPKRLPADLDRCLQKLSELPFLFGKPLLLFRKPPLRPKPPVPASRERPAAGDKRLRAA